MYTYPICVTGSLLHFLRRQRLRLRHRRHLYRHSLGTNLHVRVVQTDGERLLLLATRSPRRGRLPAQDHQIPGHQGLFPHILRSENILAGGWIAVFSREPVFFVVHLSAVEG